MAWAKKAQDAGYKFDSPKHSTLKQRLDISIPPTLHGSVVRTKVFSAEELNVYEPVTLFYFDPIELLKVKFRNPNLLKNFVCYPQLKITNCGQRIYDEATSAKWFKSAFQQSPATDGSKLLPGSLFVGLCDFDNKSAINKLMRSSEHPFLMSMLNLSQKARQRSESWSMIALLPDIEVSNLKKSKSNPTLALKCLNLCHKCSDFLHKSFKDPN